MPVHLLMYDNQLINIFGSKNQPDNFPAEIPHETTLTNTVLASY